MGARDIKIHVIDMYVLTSVARSDLCGNNSVVTANESLQHNQALVIWCERPMLEWRPLTVWLLSCGECLMTPA